MILRLLGAARTNSGGRTVRSEIPMTAQIRTIYLDNSHLHLLSELRRTKPTRFESFLRVWTAHDCVLALSQAHLSEINRYEDQTRREARYEFLATLLPIYSDLPIGDD